VPIPAGAILKDEREDCFFELLSSGKGLFSYLNFDGRSAHGFGL
jgi:hypothetical protein